MAKGQPHMRALQSDAGITDPRLSCWNEELFDGCLTLGHKSWEHEPVSMVYSEVGAKMHTEHLITGFGALQLSDSKLRSHNFVDARASRNKASATTNTLSFHLCSPHLRLRADTPFGLLQRERL